MYMQTRPAFFPFVDNCHQEAFPGQWIKTTNEGIQHHGVITAPYLNPATNTWTLLVAHTTPANGVHVSTLGEFHGGRSITLVASPVSLEHQQLILATATVNLGQPYAVFNKNCEHFASHCFAHKAESLQVQNVLALLLTGVAVVGALTFTSSGMSRRVPGR